MFSLIVYDTHVRKYESIPCPLRNLGSSELSRENIERSRKVHLGAVRLRKQIPSKRELAKIHIRMHSIYKIALVLNNVNTRFSLYSSHQHLLYET